MLKKIVLLLTVFFFGYRLAWAGLLINEIMYDLEGADTGREWIEVFNDSDTAIDLSTYKFFEANTNHGLSVSEGDANLRAQSYAVVVSDSAKFKIDWPNFSGAIFDSSFSLSNEGEPLAVKDGNLNIIDQYAYSSATGAMGDGNSLQKIGGIWMGRPPSPGTTNESAPPPPPPSPGGEIGSGGGAGGSATTSASASDGTKNKIIEEPKIKTKILTKNIALAGLSASFGAEATGYSGEPLPYGKYFWNFGDGDSKEIKVGGMEKFTHTYFYPGEYLVTLEYYSNYYGIVPDASDKITIKVVPADILISKVGDEKDFFVELWNNTGYDADISGWTLLSAGKSFTLPRNTTIGSKKKIIISSEVTNFSVSDKNTLKLTTPQHEIVSDYSPPVMAVAPAKAAVQSKASPLSQNPADSAAILEIQPPEEYPKNENEITLTVPASVIQSDILKNNSGDKYQTIIYLISFVFIGASAGAVYFLRQKKIIPKAGDDFKILDE